METVETAFIFCIFNIMLEFLKPFPLIFLNIYYHFAEFSTLSFDDITVDDVTVARDMFTKRIATGIVFQCLKILSSITIFDRHIFNNFVVTVIGKQTYW